MARAEGASEPLNERAGILHVCRFGPDVALARARRLQGPAEITAAGVLSNPSLVIEHQRTLTGAAERETIVGVSVPLHLSGRRGLLQEAAEARVQEANADADTTLFDSVLGFREAFVAAALDLAEAQVLADQQSALDSLSTTIQALSQSGEAAGYDLLRQRAEARLHRIQLETRRATALASRALAERWTDAELMLSPIDPFSLAGSPIGANVLEVPDRSSPHVRSLRAAHRASTLEATAARCRWVPEFQLFGGYRALDVEGETAHGLSLELTVPLTFFDHGQGEAARADAQARVARAEAAQVEQLNRAELAAGRVRLERLLASVAEIDQATAEATALQAQARQLYTAGEATITELLEAFRSAEALELARLDRARELAQTRLSLMRATGSFFDAELDAACSAQERKR